MSRDGDLEDIELVLVDGDNLLHDIRGSRDEGGVAWLLPRLIGWRPEGVRIVVALDGHAAPGEASRRRVTRGIEFLHSGSRSGDDMLVALLESRPYTERARTVVVTRDRGLQDRVRGAGGRTRSVDWLMRHVNEAAASGAGTGSASKPVGIGQGKAPRERHSDPASPNHVRRERWQPGRGATKKRGNPKRNPKRSRRR